MSFEALFARPAALPTVPKVVHQLIRSFGREDVALEEIADMLAADPVLSAKTLRLANSAYFHLSRHIATVDDALRMLGFVMVRNLVVGSGVSSAFKPMAGIDLPQFWRYSLHTACVARWLARAGRHNGDLCFTVGLFHALGQLLMHTVAPEQVKPLDEQCHPLAAGRAALEQAELGYHYAAVGAELALLWKFPADVADPMRAAVDPLKDSPTMPLAALVHIASWRARIDALQLDADEAAQTCPKAVARTLDIEIEWLPDAATIGVEHPDLPAQVPSLPELCQGLETMLG